MVVLVYTTYISVDLAHQVIFHATVGKGGINVADFYAHRSRVRKQVKMSGSCLSTIYGFESKQLSKTLMSYQCSDIFFAKLSN